MTKLAPACYLGQMLGTWFTASALGNLIAGLAAGHLADETSVDQMPTRFLMIFVTTAGAGLLLWLASPHIRRWMGNLR